MAFAPDAQLLHWWPHLAFGELQQLVLTEAVENQGGFLFQYLSAFPYGSILHRILDTDNVTLRIILLCSECEHRTFGRRFLNLEGIQTQASLIK
jgi:hypothetical protein